MIDKYDNDDFYELQSDMADLKAEVIRLRILVQKNMSTNPPVNPQFQKENTKPNAHLFDKKTDASGILS